MKRMVAMLVVLLLVLAGATVGVHQRKTAKLRDDVARDLELATKRVIERNPPAQNPLHENGFQCLAGMLDVLPKDLAPFEAPPDLAMQELLSGQHPERLDASMRARLQALTPWMKSMRECGHSARLGFNAGLTPWDSPTLRHGQLLRALVVFFRFANVELQALLADGQGAAALERCSETLALGADLTHLGIQGSALMRIGLRTVVPLCATALAASEPEVKAQVARQWATLPARLAPAQELVEAERLSTAVLGLGWSAGLPNAAPAPEVMGFLNRVKTQRLWANYDEAMRKLAAVAATPGPARVEASQAVLKTWSASWVPPGYATVGLDYEKFLVGEDENDEVLTLMLALALGDESPRPHVTRGQGFVTFTPTGAEPLIIPTTAIKD
jgi:hypothetical protein